MTRLSVCTAIPAIALVLIGGGAAQARTAEVRYADLNLSSQAGKAELDRRVQVAVRRACTPDAPIASRFADKTELKRCEAEARAQIAAALHN